MDTTDLIRRAKYGLNGKHPSHGFPIQDGANQATAHALVALVAEQQATNQHLASIAESLAALAATQQPPGNHTPEPEPKRRLWLPSRRR
ncbi:hypothetical protein [Streptomyces sp. NPDC095613]|uniref:hypothetical protein n=1 Tax=Streptomyces sp. NPDC095613 TaxID=3155540 RepID=UPI00331AFBA0